MFDDCYQRAKLETAGFVRAENPTRYQDEKARREKDLVSPVEAAGY
jgi:hypothetical protein